MLRLLNIIRACWAALTLAILAAITFLSLWPLQQLPPVPGTDKTHHLIAYAILMFPAALRKPKNRLLIGLLFVAYSGAIELVQPYVNRYGEWLDMLANVGGLVCGVLAARAVNVLASGRNNRYPKKL
jgi:hypothetical protein